MDVLAQDVQKFLAEVGYTTSSDFLASPSTVLASQYEGWRAKNQKPKLRQDARSVVFTWKQEVAKTISSQQTHSGGSGSGKTSTTSTPPQQSRMSLPTASNRKPKTTEQSEITKEPIVVKLAVVSEFRENDVLAGRGGLTNQHHGNEWYRRLVRCSRGFYKNCPKHTKLLVAKAIVQSVHNNNGRFLVLDKDNKLWHELDYKKAVDKSSQALRERWEHNDDDEILQRSMTVMFNEKLKLVKAKRAHRNAVEDAVYYAVTSVALEYAKRWGTSGVAKLTNQLRPIVQSAEEKPIPKPNGTVVLDSNPPKITDYDLSSRFNAPPEYKVPTNSYNLGSVLKAGAGSQTPGSSVKTDNLSQSVGNARKEVKKLSLSRGTTSGPTSMSQSFVDSTNSTATPQSFVSSVSNSATPKAVVEKPKHTETQKEFMGGGMTTTSPHNGSPNVSHASVGNACNTDTQSHSFGSAHPFSTIHPMLVRGIHSYAQTVTTAPKSPLQNRESFAGTSKDTFGAPAPLELLAAASSVLSDVERQRSFAASMPISVSANKSMYAFTRKDAAAKNALLNESADMPSSPRGSISSPSARVTSKTTDTTESNIGKRMLSNIVTMAEIEADIQKRPKNHVYISDQEKDLVTMMAVMEKYSRELNSMGDPVLGIAACKAYDCMNMIRMFLDDMNNRHRPIQSDAGEMDILI